MKANIRIGKGRLLVLSAPSGAGKTTLCKRILADVPGIDVSVSYTTRAPRKGEVNDVDYTFVDMNEFERMVQAGEFIEWASVYGNRYGTARRRVEEILAQGRDVMMDIDSQGAGQIRASGIAATYVFIIPPSLDTLSERLIKRDTDTVEVIRGRLESSKAEIMQYRNYDYIVVNEDIERAVADVASIITADRLRVQYIDPEVFQREFSL
jgi:guanylate kinase